MGNDLFQKTWPVLILVGLVGLWLVTRLVPGGDPGPHEHPSGQHGGQIISLHGDRYHIEAVFERGNLLRLYTLGRDMTRIVEVQTQSLTAYLKIEGETEAVPMALEADPQPGDAPGRTSRFTGTVSADLAGQIVLVTIPNVKLNGQRFHVSFAPKLPGHDLEMPAGATGEEEQELYFVPAGKYTAADIAANGNITASQKYKGFRAKHDPSPRPGELVCPVTFTKANPKCTWIIDGKVYQFCCPPCIDELVRLAREEPEALKEPHEYVKR